jgi:hypothetical protein
MSDRGGIILRAAHPTRRLVALRGINKLNSADVIDQAEIIYPLCPACGRGMSLANTIPKVGSAPELRTYRCEPCGSMTTKEIVFNKAQPKGFLRRLH